MINIQTLTADDKSVRTQITLTEQLKILVEGIAQEKGESLSEYLRKAAIVRLLVEETEKENLSFDILQMELTGTVLLPLQISAKKLLP